jgi:biopolymer transport protein ExbD
MKKLGQTEDVGAEMSFQIAPLIDLTFQLLIFFMCASHWNVIQSVDLEIPLAKKAFVPKERPGRVVINIKKDGSLYKGQMPVANLEELKAIIKEEKAGTPNLKIYMRADQKTQHLHVKKVMAVMAEEGIDDFIFGAFLPDK